MYVVVAVTVGVNGWSCAVIVSVPAVALPAVYATCTAALLSLPNRCGVLVIFSLSNIEKWLNPVAVPPVVAVLVSPRFRNAPGTG